jgi:NAD(P)-dependent dehydrogenase (short-subunit alcohol dehydrogenase family)
MSLPGVDVSHIAQGKQRNTLSKLCKLPVMNDDFSEIFSIKDKTALITGGSEGIGYWIAEGFLRSGATVYIAARTFSKLKTAESNLSKFGDVTAIQCDVRSAEECSRLIDDVKAQESKLHILVNNAGTSYQGHIEEFPDSAWDNVLSTNLKAPFRLTRLALPLLRAAYAENDPARVINIGSIDGLTVSPFENYSYSASKAAIHHLTRHMASRLAPKILVNAIAPGPFPTDMMKNVLERSGDEIRAASPVKRIGCDEDIAAAAVYLASRATNYMTGAVIPLDGGFSTTLHIPTDPPQP